jgi:hypothetical protein
MTQIEAKMDLIWFIQVSEFIFVLKINFCNYFSIFILLWAGRQILESAGAIP